MRTTPLPKSGTRSRALLDTLLAKPGTFYQVCERAGFDLEDSSTEHALRAIFNTLITGRVQLHGIVYSLTPDARRELNPPPPAYVGQPAGPAYRGTTYVSQPRIVRRDAGVRA